MRNNKYRPAAFLAIAAMTLQGCGAMGNKSNDSDDSGGFAKTALQSIVCLGGGAVAGLWAKRLAASEAQRQKLTPAEASKREKGYVIAFALVGCGVGAALAGTVYSGLSNAGKRAREQELREAAASAKPRTYRDPDNPRLVGTVTPQPAYVDQTNRRECRDVVDHLADGDKGEPIVIKYCRDLAGGGWKQATA